MPFSQLEVDKTPEKVVTVAPAEFADEWANKPKTDVAVGLRRLSQRALEDARREAELEAIGFYDRHGDDIKPDAGVFVEIYNDALLCNALARATTDPNDRTVAYFGDTPGDTIRLAMTSEGLKRLWGEYVRFEKSTGLAHEPASDEDLVRLGRALASGLVSPEPALRKLLAYCLSELGDVPEAAGDENEDDAESATYHVSGSA